VESGRLATGNHALCCGRNLPRTSGAKCGGNLEAAANFEHGDNVVDGDAIGQSEASRSNIDGTHCVVERVALIGALSCQFARQLRGVFTVC
jgi:hypothetical protein